MSETYYDTFYTEYPKPNLNGKSMQNLTTNWGQFNAMSFVHNLEATRGRENNENQLLHEIYTSLEVNATNVGDNVNVKRQ